MFFTRKMDACVFLYFCMSDFWCINTRQNNTVSVFLDLCIGYILIKLDAKYYYNVTSYKSFINKVYDLVGQPSYVWWTWILTDISPMYDEPEY